MAENSNDRKNPRGNNNIYWIYVVVLAFFLLGTWVLNNAQGKVELYKSDLVELQEKGYIKEVKVINGTEVRVFLNEDGIKAERAKPGRSNLPDSGPQYYVKMLSPDAAAEFLDSNGINYMPEDETRWGDVVQFLIPIAILIALWFFFMRRVGAGGAG